MSTGKRLVLEDEFLDGEENDSKQSQQQTQDSSNHNNNNNRQIIITVNNSGVTNKNGSDPSKERNSNPAVANMIEAHRKSLISLGGMGGGGGGGGGGGAGAGGSLGQNGQPQFTADDLAQFTSITLSKRHFFTETEYEKGADLDTFKKLSEFKFDETTSNNSANNSGGAVAVSGSNKTTGE